MSEAEEGESLSNDPDEAKWDYFREESLLHVFHSLLHKVWDGGITSGQLATRIHELFFYAHQQFIRRYLHKTCYTLFFMRFACVHIFQSSSREEHSGTEGYRSSDSI